MSGPNVFIGVDPGASGGIVFLDDAGIVAHKMPATERDVWDVFAGQWGVEAFAMIESVHSMPGQGVSSSFRFGMSYGMLRGILTASGIPWETVTPQKWQRELGVLKKKGHSKPQHKNALKSKAQQLFPQEKWTLATCDAGLIAEYARRVHI